MSSVAELSGRRYITRLEAALRGRLGYYPKAEKRLSDLVTHVYSPFGIGREIGNNIPGHIGAERGSSLPGMFAALTHLL
ncbi:MAG: hypothetical protein QOF56_1562 [Acidobacteriaceae bacterium]|jgi:hypothetical protein|nr:hypothetical protein [Acidobacteriaceae bacterium]